MNDDPLLEVCGMWLAIIIFICMMLLFSGCADHSLSDEYGQAHQRAIGTVQDDPNPLTFWWYSTAESHQGRARAAIEGALDRWNAAACLDMDISFDAHHWVRFTNLANGGANIGGTWESARIRLDIDLEQRYDIAMLMHEICHLLRRNNSHIGEACNSPTADSARIVTADLEAVCSKQDCGCFLPEL